MRNTIRGATVAGQVRTLLEAGAAGGLADGELLGRFAARDGDAAEAAFAAMVERHGPMVLRACRSILRDPHRAQDAFQSTFLLLARRADSLWVRDSLGPWLHSVACRVASGARAADGRRRALERRAAGRSSRSADEPGRDDLGPALHEEIERLPDRLRAPLVLCYLEGLTHDQAADHLGCPVGTVRSRLARGRDRLRRGLARRGFAPPPSDHDSPPAILPASLAALTVRAARLASGRPTMGLIARWLAFLSEGVIEPMMIHPLKSAAVILIASGAIAAGLGVTSGQDSKPPEKAPIAAETPRDRSADDKRFEAIEKRLRDLEFQMEEMARFPGPRARKFPIDQDTLVKVRSPVDNSLVERVFVTIGQVVKKGDPILVIRSAELGQAKNELRTRYVQWDHDRKIMMSREQLAKDGRITQMAWTDTQNDEKKSRLDYLVSRDRLNSYGMGGEQVDKLLDGLDDDRKGPPKKVDDTQDIARMTVLSPIDGVVLERDADKGAFYDRSNVLIVIGPPKPEARGSDPSMPVGPLRR